MVDILITSFFVLTSVIWWFLMVVFFFAPFYFLRRAKIKLAEWAKVLERYSDIKLDELRKLKRKMKITKVIDLHSKSTYNQISDKVNRRLIWYLRLAIINAVPKNARVLDIGCGNGYLAQLLKEVKKAEVVCCDIANFNKSGIETILYDGVNLPFADKSFDRVILSYVLHHSSIPEQLLREAARVSRGKILIYEDQAMVGQKILAKFHESAYNFLYDLDSPVRYYSIGQWREIFERLKLKVIEEDSHWNVGAMLMPLKSAFFVLESRN